MARRTWDELEANLPDNTSGLIDAVHVREALIDSQRPHVEARPPDTTDNASLGFDVGHTWIDSSASPWPEAWRCVYSDTMTAIWARIEGPPGPPGEPGEPGADGTPQWMGAWTAGTYQAGQAVSHNGSSYVANTETSEEPPHADWDILAARGAAGGIEPTDGLVVVKHGANAAAARPTAATVYWMGSVAPDNKQTGDLWLETDAFDGGS